MDTEQTDSDEIAWQIWVELMGQVQGHKSPHGLVRVTPALIMAFAQRLQKRLREPPIPSRQGEYDAPENSVGTDPKN